MSKPVYQYRRTGVVIKSNESADNTEAVEAVEEVVGESVNEFPVDVTKHQAKQIRKMLDEKVG